MHPWPDLQPLLRGLAWAVVGGVATRAYMPERATQDLDILVHREDGDQALARLEAAGYVRTAALALPGYVLRSPEGVEIDLILGDAPWMAEALAHPRRDPAGYPALDLPYLVLMKIEASRLQDLSDLARMLGLAADQDLARVRSVISRYAPDLGDDVESLIYLGKLEVEGHAE